MGKDSESEGLKKKVQEVDGREMSRSSRIERRYRANGADTQGEKSEKKYRRKLDYRCEGGIYTIELGTSKLRESVYLPN